MTDRISAPRRRGALARSLILIALSICGLSSFTAALELQPGDRIVFVGNTFAERLRLFGHLETGLLLAYPEHDLSFRNLAWSGDEIDQRPRPLNFGDLETHLRRQQADVVFLFYGANESWEGETGLGSFRSELQAFVQSLAAKSFSDAPPRLVLVSTIPQEQIGLLPDPADHNHDLARYSEAIRAVAVELDIPYVDLFSPMESAMTESKGALTINGVHLNEQGDRIAADLFLRALGKPRIPDTPAAETIRTTTIDKNRLFFDRYRAVNGYYIYGDRKEPFGVKSFPAEMKRFDELVDELDRKLQRLARESRRGSR